MKLCLKSFTGGVLVAVAGIMTVATVFAAVGIKSADFNSNKIVFDGNELDLSASPMISVVKEGETNASNYMPLRSVLEQMGYSVEWNGETKTVVVTSAKDAEAGKPQDETAESSAVGIANPWITCTEDEAFNYLGATFEIEPPTGYKFSEAATLSVSDGEAKKTARFVYRNDSDEMFRVHITADGSEELTGAGEPVKSNGIDAYYSDSQSSVSYVQEDYMITIDMLGKSEDVLLEMVGKVTIQK